ncbi:SPOSA6832_01081 [Sporobolomyces salmonicolor]|uniref:Peptide hydrolase n=1 Tax=Sporidiobolus salmonicolor TaxID=5005 RepID=A0A0D6EIW4_SPOSA|nr:SPOSA6832_01081 [Sporobolomyces salmonicolor]
MVHLSLPLLAGALATLSTALPVREPSQLTFSAAPSVSLRSQLNLSALEALPLSELAQLEQHIARFTEKRLVKLAEDAEPLEITEGEKALLVFSGKRFIDVTADDDTSMAVQSSEPFPKKLVYNTKALQPLFDRISLAHMKKFLSSFSGFRTRYYRSSEGKQSQQFLLGQIKEISSSNEHVKVKVSEFEHSWGQNSIIVRFNPAESAKKSDQVDSTNLLPFLGAPGADDDGSGTTSLLETFRTLVNASFVPSTYPVELHWYSAEEGGLLGSKAIAQAYAREARKVRAMLQMDMTAWVKEGTKPTVGLIQDYVSAEFTDYLGSIINEYSEIGFTPTTCGYACNSNHNIHSTKDTIDYSSEFSFEHMAQFTRVAIALAVELGGDASVVA